MNEDSSNEFLDALNKEFGIEPPTPETPPENPVTPPETPPQDPTPGTNGEGGEEQKPAVTEGQAAPEGDGDKPTEGEPAKPSGEEQPQLDENGNPKAPEPPKPEEPKFATKDDIKEAMREYNSDVAGRVDRVNSARDEVINVLHPEGIDKNIYDSNGKIIKTAQDIVDRGLFKPGTEEPFTYEEAASWLLNAQRQTNENIAEMQQYAENVAETNVSLVESNQRVLEQWGDVLKAMPKLADELAETYINTQLTWDKTKSFVTNVSMSPEQFYQLTLAPYKQLAEHMVQSNQSAEAQAAKEAAEAAAAEQAERTGIPPQRGTSATKANTGDPMLDALIDELGKE